MYYQHDWFMIQIQMMVQFIAKVVFNKDPYEIEAFYETESAEGGNDPLDKALASYWPNPGFRRRRPWFAGTCPPAAWRG